MKTRKDYLSGECSHREYYAQFVDSEIRGRVSFLRSQIENSDDAHLNDIPLKVWDGISADYTGVGHKLKEAGDYLTKAGWVCILKEAARQLVEVRL